MSDPLRTSPQQAGDKPLASTQPPGIDGPTALGSDDTPPPPRPSAATAEAVARLFQVPGFAEGAAGEPPPDGPDPAEYRVLRRLGQGAMGEVYLARHGRLKRLVALKMICTGPAGAALRGRFLAEAEVVARLQHPNIVQIYEVGEASGRPFLALEYVDGGGLDERLRGTLLPEAQVAELVQTLARAVQHAHERGIVHRDLKPANILLRRKSEARNPKSEQGSSDVSDFEFRISDYEPKVSDFGLSKIVESGTPSAEDGDEGIPHAPLATSLATRTGAVVGTPSYMAPEQAAGEPDGIGPRTDVYALGAVLYECLTGRPPFKGATVRETLAQVRECEPVAVRPLRPGVPRDLETITLKCLHKEPARRYATAAELADDLGRFLNGEPIRARPVGAAERFVKWVRRRPVVAGLGALSAAALVSLFVGGAVYQVLLRDALNQADRQREQADRERGRAEANYQKALAAVQRLLTRVGQDRLVNVPEMEGVRAELLRDAFEFYQGFLANADSPDAAARWETALALGRVALIQRYLGRSEEADAHYRQALAQLTALAAEFPDRPEYRDGLADARRQYGELLARGSSPDQAGDQFAQARQVWLDLAAARPDQAHYRAQVATCDHLEGWWHKQAGRLAEAEAAYQRALALRRALAERDATDDARRDLAMTLHNLAGVHSLTRRPNEAIEHEAEAVRLFEVLARARPGDEESQSLWGAGLHNLGVLQSWTGRLDDAHRCHEQALKLREAQARAHPLLPDCQSGWAQSCMSLAAVDLERRRYADAEPHARQAVAIYERLVEQWPQNTGYAADLLGTQTNLANLYQATKRPDEAAAVYARALAVAERLIGEQPDNLHHATALAALCINRGNLDKDGGRPRDALAWYERSIRSAERALAKDGRLAEARTWLEYAHGARAQAHEQLRDYAAAVRDWDRVIELTKAEDRHVSRLLRVAALARAGTYDRAASEVDALAADQPKDEATLWHLAGCCAAASAAAAADEGLSTAERPRRAEALAARGVELLRQARPVTSSGGRWGFLAKVTTDPDLKPLHGREDFKGLVRESLMNWPQMNTDKHR